MASSRVKATIAPLVPAYTECSGNPSKAWMDVRLITTPWVSINCGKSGLREKELGAYVHIVQRVELLRRDILKREVHRDTGVVDEHIKPAKKFDRLLCEFFDGVDIREVRFESNCFPARTLRSPITADAAPSALWA